MTNEAPFTTLIGEVIKKVVGLECGDTDVWITTASGREFHMYHRQDCCESVAIEDLYGEVDNLLDTPILFAEEKTYTGDNFPNPCNDNSFTWTFYTLGTVKGWIDIRWYGSSNGYHSESVDFEEITS